ncbi:hypothetical protein H4219_004810 [Mycoemilia scoparia]|uniref:Ribosome assembly protein 3 n=1 Tax=Mycoemilia scoparia TaxID=417184 RepID=A0A9W7ZW84_9FUNG|nr:hypothetical protein H4219_004810 [Mycoemilia scoparia]
MTSAAGQEFQEFEQNSYSSNDNNANKSILEDENSERLYSIQKRLEEQSQELSTHNDNISISTNPTNLELVNMKNGNKKLDALSNDAFRNLYMDLLTQGFGNDLNQLREKEDLNSNNIVMLIDALESGQMVFDDFQKQELTGSEEESSQESA